jgi:hypothetical protein
MAAFARSKRLSFYDLMLPESGRNRSLHLVIHLPDKTGQLEHVWSNNTPKIKLRISTVVTR